MLSIYLELIVRVVPKKYLIIRMICLMKFQFFIVMYALHACRIALFIFLLHSPIPAAISSLAVMEVKIFVYYISNFTISIYIYVSHIK